MDIYPEFINLKIVLLLTIGFGLASLLGYLSFRLNLSPILGYLIAGYLIGPFSPGFTADRVVSDQLAEIGVILMMFGVGLHFRWKDLVSVKDIAIPGALFQTIIATLIGTLLIYAIGWPLESGIIIGLSIGVASTVVLVRVLTENRILATPEGHIAVGWLIVEDIITVLVLLLLPTWASSLKGHEASIQTYAWPILTIVIKFILLVLIMFTIGHKVVKYVLTKIVLTGSRELFTLTILALTFLIAIGASLLFGTSIALGAFIAGMVVSQTDVRHQVSVNAKPLKDTFVVIFFLSVGMLFDPFAIWENFPLFLGVLAIVLFAKPIAAFLITIGLKYPVKTALTISLALAQIGEFSFILAEEALRFEILPQTGYDIIVACALVSISINPILFKLFKPT